MVHPGEGGELLYSDITSAGSVCVFFLWPVGLGHMVADPLWQHLAPDQGLDSSPPALSFSFPSLPVTVCPLLPCVPATFSAALVFVTRVCVCVSVLVAAEQQGKASMAEFTRMLLNCVTVKYYESS